MRSSHFARFGIFGLSWLAVVCVLAAWYYRHHERRESDVAQAAVTLTNTHRGAARSQGVSVQVRAPPLVQMATGMTTLPSRADKKELCIALATDGGPRAIQQLIDVINGESDEIYRYELVQSLQAITKCDASELLCGQLTNELVTGCFLLALVDIVPRLATPALTRRLVDMCRATAEDGEKHDWILTALAGVRGEGVADECGRLLMVETSREIELGLASALIREGSPESIQAIIDKIEVSGVTNTEGTIVEILSQTESLDSLDFMINEVGATTNQWVKWALATVIARQTHPEGADE